MTEWRELIEASGSGIRPGPPSSDAQLDETEDRLGVRIPEQLRHLYRYADGLFDEPGEWFVVWPLARVVADNLMLRAAVGLPTTLLAFGDDGTGDPFCVDLASDNDRAVWMFSCIEGEATALAPDLETFWREWTSRSG